jgi:hypothetical protein
MDMQLYTLHVVPTVLIIFGVFVLFMHPPVKVISATLLGGLVMAILNMVADKIAIMLGIWHYSASGLFAQLPLPLYTTSLFITGGLAYLLIWRNWRGRTHWLALLLLGGVPLLGFLRDFWQAGAGESNSYLVWQSPLAWVGDLILWAVMFLAGYLVFQRMAPARVDVLVQVEHEKVEVVENVSLHES